MFFCCTQHSRWNWTAYVFLWYPSDPQIESILAFFHLYIHLWIWSKGQTLSAVIYGFFVAHVSIVVNDDLSDTFRIWCWNCPCIRTRPTHFAKLDAVVLTGYQSIINVFALCYEGDHLTLGILPAFWLMKVFTCFQRSDRMFCWLKGER